MEETVLYYRMTPDRSLTTSNYTEGINKSKERINVALCCNMDGSEKLRLLVIGKCAKPRCFKKFNVGLYCDYVFNKKAWMNSTTFVDWIQKFDRKMKNAGRNILLLIDNAPSHFLPKFISCHQPPQATCSHLTPASSTVITCSIGDNNSDKSLIKSMTMAAIASQSQTPSATQRKAWNQVTSITIVNCWDNTRIAPVSAPIVDEIEDPEDNIPLARLVERAVISLRIDSAIAITANDFVSVDSTS